MKWDVEGEINKSQIWKNRLSGNPYINTLVAHGVISLSLLFLLISHALPQRSVLFHLLQKGLRGRIERKTEVENESALPLVEIQ